MDSKSKLPTMIKKPTVRVQVPSDRLIPSQTTASSLAKSSTANGTRIQLGNRSVLAQNFENVCNMMNNGPLNRAKPTKRHASPEFRATNTMNHKKLRRSRSVSDMQSLLSKHTQRQPLQPLETIPANMPRRPINSSAIFKKPAVSITSDAKKKDETIKKAPAARVPPIKSSATKAPAAKATPAMKRIPAYDFKSRFHDLSERHKVLKEKHDQLKERMAEFDELPDKYDLCCSQLRTIENEYTSVKSELKTLQKHNADDKLKIQTLTDELNAKIEECRTVIEVNKKLTTEYDTLHSENDQLKNNNCKLETEIKNYRSVTDEKLAKLETELNETRDQLYRANTDRKELHNAVMDLRGNIRVFCRVRPPLQNEANRQICTWNYQDETSLEICNQNDSKKSVKHDFTFDRVFAPNSEQQDIFEMVSPLIQSALDGYNVCIFAYGQTGSGKTFTMDGIEGEGGIIPRTIDFLFKCFEQYRNLGWEYKLCASFLEIYNETLFDLLSNETKDLEIRMVSAKAPTEIFVSNLTEVNVESKEDLHRLMQMAKSNRATAATAGNERSSRSHAVTQLRLIGEHLQKSEQSIGTVNLIDLAGSESPKTSARMDETKKINKSLSELTNVIMALLQKQEHVPYRNSKLTHLLMPSLGGNSKTLMFVNVSPFVDCFVETVKSLRFAASVNMCKMNKAKKNKCYTSPYMQSTTSSLPNNEI